MIINPYGKVVTVTKSDTINFDGTDTTAAVHVPALPADAIMSATAGVVVAITQDGALASITALAGVIYPIRAVRINSTNTVPSLLYALYNV